MDRFASYYWELRCVSYGVLLTYVGTQTPHKASNALFILVPQCAPYILSRFQCTSYFLPFPIRSLLFSASPSALPILFQSHCVPYSLSVPMRSLFSLSTDALPILSQYRCAPYSFSVPMRSLFSLSTDALPILSQYRCGHYSLSVPMRSLFSQYRCGHYSLSVAMRSLFSPCSMRYLFSPVPMGSIFSPQSRWAPYSLPSPNGLYILSPVPTIHETKPSSVGTCQRWILQKWRNISHTRTV